MIEENVKKLLEEIPAYNAYGEKVTLVAAVKLQTADSINRAVRGGITDIGDNHAATLSDGCRRIKLNTFWERWTFTTRLTDTA